MHRRTALVRAPHDAHNFFGAYRRVYNAAPHRPSFAQQQPMRVALEDYQTAKQTTAKIIDRAVKQPPNWKDTRTLRGKEKRLESMINSIEGRHMSVEKETFEMDTDGESYSREENDREGTNAIYPPGTFIETRRNFTMSYGVVLGEQYVLTRRRMVTLTSTGEVWYPGRQDILYSFPNFAPPDLIERCGTDAAPKNDTEKHARIEVLRRLQDLQRTSEVMYNIVAQRSSDVYDQVKSPDPNAWATTTLSEVAQLIKRRKKIDDMLVFGLHQYIIDHPLYFIAHHNYESTGMIFVRPQSHVNDINTVQEWIRRRDSPLASFVARAKEIMPLFAKRLKSSKAEQPSYERASHAWTDTDQTIIRFLQRSLRQTRSNQADPYTIGISYIMKQLYPGESVNNNLIHDIVLNLGILAPWQDLASLDPMLQVDTEPEPSSSHRRQQEAIVTRSFASIDSSGAKAPLGPEDFYRTDPLDSVRHDFGDLPVFVIDDATAQELDDGISIERIPSEPDNVWIHTHIADPAALIPPTHILAKTASQRATSVYFKHRNWPLFPTNIMNHPTHGLSLSMGRVLDGSPLKVLTFSSKVDSLGELIDFKVRAGLVRNIHVITYGEADAALGHTLNLVKHPFGRKLPPKVMQHSLPQSHVQDLRDLKKVVDTVAGKRFRSGVINLAKNIAELTPIVRPPPDIFGLVSEPLAFRGFPTFEYSVSPSLAQDTGSRSLVAESMKLACRVASRFCTQHNIPVMRRVCDPGSMRFFGDIEDILSMRAPNCAVDRHAVIDRIEAPPTSGYSLEPKAHYNLGAADGEGYTRVTSPLRRYLDLVAHWQIHHALLGSKAPKNSPPFSAEEIWNITKVSSQMEDVVKVLERIHHRFWQVMFIKRWKMDHKDESHSLLDNLEVYANSAPIHDPFNGKFQVVAECPELGLDTTVLNPPQGLPPGSKISVRLQELVLGTRPQIMTVTNDLPK